MKKVIFSLILVIVLVLFFPQSLRAEVQMTTAEEEVRGVVERFFNAFITLQYTTILQCLHPDSPLREDVREGYLEYYTGIMQDLIQAAQLGVSISITLEISKTQVMGGTAYVYVDEIIARINHATFPNAIEVPAELPSFLVVLKREKGEWLIVKILESL